MELYRVISMDDYNKYLEKKEEKPVDSELAKLPKIVQRKIKKILDCFTENDVLVDPNGVVKENSEYFSAGDNILPHLVYSIKGGKDKPSDWTNFVSLLITCKLPKDVLSQKASQDLKRARRHAKDSSD